MTTGTEIIKRALSRIGAHSVASPANPESIEVGRLSLNSMLEMWLTHNIRIGFTPLQVPGDDLNEPADAYNAIVNNLAVRLGPDFDNSVDVVTASLVAQANADFEALKQFYQTISIPKKRVSSTLPRGQGNKRRWNTNNDRTFFGEDSALDS